MKNKTKILTDTELIKGIKERRKENPYAKISIVKWVYDNSDKGLKDSKEFVDENL